MTVNIVFFLFSGLSLLQSSAVFALCVVVQRSHRDYSSALSRSGESGYVTH